MRVQLQPAYVLHSRPYRDSSLLVEVLTSECGRLSLVAKGVRNARRDRSRAGLLQPFIPLLLSLSGRSELKTLTAVEPAGPAAALRGERLFSGIYLNELLTRLLHHHDPHPGVFVAYGVAVASLAGDMPMDDILRRFEFGLLEELGYGFDLGVDGHSGEALQAGRWYRYHQEFGLVEQRGNPDGEHPVFSGADLLGIGCGEFTEANRRAAKRLLRQALAGHLGNKPLRSRELFRQMRVESSGEVH